MNLIGSKGTTAPLETLTTNNPSDFMPNPTESKARTAEHTPLPWRVFKDGLNLRVIQSMAIPWHVAQNVADCGASENELANANAALIVEAVNNHATLKARVEALEKACQDAANSLSSVYSNPKQYIDMQLRVRDSLQSALSQREQEKG